MAGAPRPNIGPSSPPRLRAPNGGASPRFWRPCRRSVSTRISSGSSRAKRRVMYLIDTDVISEARKGDRANSGVIGFFKEIVEAGSLAFVASVTIGELRRGVELIRRRGDVHQAERLEGWLENVVDGFAERILPFDADAAQVWGRLARQADRCHRSRQRPDAGDPQRRGLPGAGQGEKSLRFRTAARVGQLGSGPRLSAVLFVWGLSAATGILPEE